MRKMKIHSYLLLFLISFLLIANCRNVNTSKDKYLTLEGITEVPNDACKRIITRYYSPLKYNKSYLLGDELDTYDQCPDTTYYDEFGNVLLKIRVHLDNSYRTINRYNYYNPKGEKLLNEYEYTQENTNGIIKTEYIRNEEGLLTEIKGASDIMMKYDKHGNRIEEYYKSENKRRIFKINKDSLYTVKIVKNINDTSSFVNNNIVGLERMQTQIIDNKTNLLLSLETESFLYGSLNNKEIYNFLYDSIGRIIQEEKTRTGKPLIKKTNTMLSKEENESLFGDYNSTIQTTIKVTKLTYDKYGNIVTKIIENKKDSSSDAYEYWNELNMYKYNERGDWIENIYYFLSEEPLYIVKREIKYYN